MSPLRKGTFHLNRRTQKRAGQSANISRVQLKDAREGKGDGKPGRDVNVSPLREGTWE